MKKIQITEKTFILTAVIGSLFIMTMLITNTILSSKQTIAATNDAVSAVSSFYLEAMADRRAKTITNLIDNSFEQMDKALLFLQEEDVQSQEELRDTIGKIKSLLSLNRFAVVDEENTVYTQYTTYTGGSRHEFLSEEPMEDRIISTIYLYGSSKQLCLAVPTPGLVIMGKPFKACFVQFDISDIVDLLAFDDQGRTYFGLYSKSGENLSDTELGPQIATDNLFEATEGTVPETVLQKLRENFADEKDGSMTFSAGGAEETLCYVPVEGTGWQMAVLIRESVIDEQIRDISEKTLATGRKQILFTLISVLVLASVLLLELRQLSGQKLEAEKKNSQAFQTMANTDALTGVRNKHAYSENEAILNREIQEGSLKKLAVVVCDINGLKFVNDNDGHAAGDKLIKEACALICDGFPHGAVYRIGGDEFAVLLQEKGYDTMKETVDALNLRVEENLRENRVVVSAGYSVLKPEDCSLHDVFERADQMMYERKKELKAMGAKTRA